MPKQTAIVTALVLERPLCFTCLAEKSGATRAEIANVLRRIAGTVTIDISDRRCHGCGDVVEAVSIKRPVS